MIVSTVAKEKWVSNFNKQHYESKGYTYTKNNDTFIVKIEDIFKKSHAKVLVRCDFCNKLFVAEYQYEAPKKKNNCRSKECVTAKRKETCYERYNGPCPSSSKIVVQKIKNTCKEKYGCEHFSQTEEGRKTISENNRKNAEKIRNSCIRTVQNRYNVDNVFQLKSVKEKIRNTNAKNHGCEYPSQCPEIRQKMEESCEKHYGKKNPMQSKEIRSKAMTTMIKQSHGTNVNTSKEQEHIWQVLGGELNKKVNHRRIDIAFPEEKIALEYDGAGHFSFYQRNNITEEQFMKQEQEREDELFRLGWKIVRFVCKKGELPDDEQLRLIFSNCKKELKTKKKVVVSFDND